MVSRRDALHAVGAGATALLPGCSLASDRPDLHLRVENYRAADLDVRVELLDSDAEDRSGAVAFSERVTLPAPSEDGEPQVWHGADVAPARSYRVEVDVTEVGRKSYHYHYVPDCTGSATVEPTVEVVLNDDPGVAFSQTRCGNGIESSP
ncbi:hypothetical protein ACKVMT_10000 [Halobacteriales archaeon Cl-PHB]